MNPNPKPIDCIFYLCSILLLLSALFYISEWYFIPYIYATSSAGITIIFLTHPYSGNNLRLKRLNIQQTIAALMLPVSSYFMFRKMNEWIICLFVSALLQLYVILVRDYEEKKNKNSTRRQ